MRRTINVALREFTATVLTKGFIFGIFFPPVIMAGAMILLPILMNQASPRVVGKVAIIDQSGQVASRLENAFTPEAIRNRMGGRFARGLRKLEESGSPTPTIDPATSAALEVAAAATGPSLTLELLPADADVQAAKGPITSALEKGGSAETRLALAVIAPGVVKRDTGGAFTPYELFVAPKLDFEVQRDIREQINRAVTDARIESAGLDPSLVRAITDNVASKTRVATPEGERRSNEGAAIFVPFGFMMLLWVSVFTGGQYLLTSTVEEKSSRVMEVLLSAVSPLELMVGKIVGQMCVAGTILVLYGVLGVGAVTFFNQGHLLDPMTFVYAAAFFIIAFFLIASMMAAIGSAVNDMREAQSLMGPFMIVLIIPMVLWMPISRNPNSLFAEICSFVPPISPFVMVVRLAGSEPIPAWQAPVAVLVGVVSMAFAAWAAAKIFRVGILMYGKPPNIGTLLRWIRMA